MKKYATNNVYWFIPERFEKKVSLKKRFLRDKKFLPSYTANLRNKNFSIVTDCCIGGQIYHDYGIQFLSPFINISINKDDFLELLSNLKLYLSSELSELKVENSYYPIGLLGNKIKIHFVHYQTFSEAKEAWIRRLKRFNYNNIVVIMTDGLANSIDKKERLNDQQVSKFLSLPYKKILITNYEKRALLNEKEIIYLKKYKHADMLYPFGINLVGGGETILEEHFNVVSWLNE